MEVQAELAEAAPEEPGCVAHPEVPPGRPSLGLLAWWLRRCRRRLRARRT